MKNARKANLELVVRKQKEVPETKLYHRRNHSSKTTWTSKGPVLNMAILFTF